MGSCCSVRRNLPLVIELDENSTVPKLSNFPTPNSIVISNSDSHYNFLIWTGTEPEFYSIFNRSYYKVLISQDQEMTLNLTPYCFFSPSSPISIDCIAYYVNTERDLEIVKFLSKKHSNIPIQILATNLKVSNFDRVVVIPPTSQNLLWNHFFIHQLNLEKLLKDTFNVLEKNNNCQISHEELQKGLQRLDSKFSLEDSKKILHCLCKNREGLLDFRAFSYCWRRGRQKKASIFDMTSSLTEKVRMFIGDSSKVCLSDGKLFKTIKIQHEGLAKIRFSVKFSVARSVKRFELLKNAEELLDLANNELWIAVVFKGKSQEISNKKLVQFKNMLHYVNGSFLNSHFLNTAKIGQAKVQLNKNEVWLSFCFNSNDSLVDPLIENLAIIDKFFDSPYDDYLNVVINSGLELKEILKRQSKNLTGSIEPGEILIESEHWSGYSEKIEVNGKISEAVLKFLSLQGENILNPITEDPFCSISYYLNSCFYPVIQLSKFIPIISDTLEFDPEELEQNLTIFIRCQNLGLELTIEGNDLDLLLNNDF